MKNLPQRVRNKRRAPSSYHRNKKRPYVYSAELRGWHDAVCRNDHNAARTQGVAWAKKFAQLWDADAGNFRRAA